MSIVGKALRRVLRDEYVDSKKRVRKSLCLTLSKYKVKPSLTKALKKKFIQYVMTHQYKYLKH